MPPLRYQIYLIVCKNCQLPTVHLEPYCYWDEEDDRICFDIDDDTDKDEGRGNDRPSFDDGEDEWHGEHEISTRYEGVELWMSYTLFDNDNFSLEAISFHLEDLLNNEIMFVDNCISEEAYNISSNMKSTLLIEYKLYQLSSSKFFFVDSKSKL